MAVYKLYLLRFCLLVKFVKGVYELLVYFVFLKNECGLSFLYRFCLNPQNCSTRDCLGAISILLVCMLNNNKLFKVLFVINC